MTLRAWMAVPAGVILLLLWTPTDDGLTLCPFALVTGHACPGCGLTRAMAYLVRGNFYRAIDYHPLSLVLALAGVVAMGWLIGKRKWGWPSPSVRTVNVALVTAGALLLGIWFTRIATGTLPPV